MFAIHSLVFHLRPEHGGRLRFTGHFIRGFVLSFVDTIDSELAFQLHSSKNLKPYGVTPLRASDEKYVFTLDVETDVVYQFRTSLLKPDLSQTFLQQLLDAPPHPIQIGDLTFEIVRIKINKWSPETFSVANIDKFRFLFDTPVYFAKQGVNFVVPLPIPAKLFYNLANMWHSFVDDSIDIEAYCSWVEENIMISGYDLHTCRPINIGNGRKVFGFLGHCNYNIRTDSSSDHTKYCRITHKLGKFAEFTNLGGNRTGGFGVVDFQPKIEEQ